MAAGVAKRDLGAARRGHNRPDHQPVAPGPSSHGEQQMTIGKRHRSAQGEDDNIAGHRRKSRRIQESTNQRPPREGREPTRQSPRLQKKQSSNLQRTRGGTIQARSQPRQRGVKHYHCLQEEDAGRSAASPTQLGAHRSTKRRHYENNEDESKHEAKRPKRKVAQLTEARARPPDKEESIENWLEGSSWARKASTEHQTHLPETLIKMRRKVAGTVLPSPDKSIESTTSMSRKSEKSTASVTDTDYRQSLRYRNIYVNHGDPSPELMRRAKRIISRSRTSPEMDGQVAQQLILTSRRVEEEGEEAIIQQLAPDIIPAMKVIPDQRLASNADQPWTNSVPVSLDPSILTSPLPLPKPKPDLTFGYSQAAFTRNQLGTIELLIEDQYGRSFAVPDQKLRFPFLCIEFKSQAKNGTHYTATNQVAGAGAIALNGMLDLMERSFGLEKFDYEEPQFFSTTMDHELARLNVHWVRAPAEGGLPSFHVESLSKHLLDDENGIRAVSRAIKNILDHGADLRLQTLCNALDAYRETVVRNRETANAQRRQGSDIAEPQAQRQTQKRVLPPEPQGYRGTYEKDARANRPPDNPVEQLQTERRPRRARTTVLGEERSRDKSDPKTRRTSYRRVSRAVESGLINLRRQKTD